MTAQPKHIAVIMDGNGRWARERGLPRVEGHQEGANAGARVIEFCQKKKIPYLTLFAFSRENWQRSEDEIQALMTLFLQALENQTNKLQRENIRFCVIGDRSRFSSQLVSAIEQAEALTADNTGLCVTLALDYSGRWDIVQAAQTLSQRVARGELQADAIDEPVFSGALSLKYLPDPDLLVRTSGELRLSNFLLWHFAYTELYFTDCYWPDFSEEHCDAFMKAFAKRERRFGKVSNESV